MTQEEMMGWVLRVLKWVQVAAVVLIVAFILAMLFVLPARAAEPLTVGLHTLSTHVPHYSWQNNTNPGLYARWGGGWTVGGYRNTFRRTSLYAGYTFEYEAAPWLSFGLSVAAITGYQREEVREYKPIGSKCDDGNTLYGPYDYCRATLGYSRGAITLMLAPSVAVPLGAGYTARLAAVPRLGGKLNSSTVAHFMIEKEI